MASPVIQSVSNTAWQNSISSLVITKPTGLAVGDLMVGVVFGRRSNGAVITPATRPAGWTEVSTNSPATAFAITVAYKIADASAVSASNFSFATSNASDTYFIGSLYRVTGYASANPVRFVLASDTTSDMTASFTFSHDTIVNDTLLLMCILGSDDENASGYTISGTNPTWTERLDVTLTTAGDDGVALIASAVKPTAGVLTTASATYSAPVASNYLAFLTLSPQQDANVTTALHEAEPTFFDPVVQVDTNVSTGFHESEPTFFDPNGIGTSPTTWVKPSKTATTWIKPQKP